MAVYEVFLSKAASKQLKTFPAFIHNNIIEEILSLSANPRPPGCTKLKKFKNALSYWHWRLQGDL